MQLRILPIIQMCYSYLFTKGLQKNLRLSIYFYKYKIFLHFIFKKIFLCKSKIPKLPKHRNFKVNYRLNLFFRIYTITNLIAITAQLTIQDK